MFKISTDALGRKPQSANATNTWYPEQITRFEICATPDEFSRHRGMLTYRYTVLVYTGITEITYLGHVPSPLMIECSCSGVLVYINMVYWHIEHRPTLFPRSPAIFEIAGA